jgi:hypothetical protein
VTFFEADVVVVAIHEVRINNGVQRLGIETAALP